MVDSWSMVKSIDQTKVQTLDGDPQMLMKINLP